MQALLQQSPKQVALVAIPTLGFPQGVKALTWIEEGGPPVQVPQRRGFGSRLIERSLQGEIGGQAVLDFRPGGLFCEIRMPLQAGV